jgi:hypothetical protein
MSRHFSSPRPQIIRATVLRALRHSLSASRLSLKAQTHACESGPQAFHDMAEATDQMIGALESLHETLVSLNLALEMRDIDLSRPAEFDELTWPPSGRAPLPRP